MPIRATIRLQTTNAPDGVWEQLPMFREEQNLLNDRQRNYILRGFDLSPQLVINLFRFIAEKMEGFAALQL